jgi:carbonic anhydrase
MKKLPHLFENNKKWAEGMRDKDPGFFNRLSAGQKPGYLWIGCSDSRVPANQIVDLPPGALFVHRNIANVVIHTDLNCLSVIQYAVEVLEIPHIIICGHYGCGGIKAAMEGKAHGLIDNWLRHIKDVYRLYRDQIDELDDPAERLSLLCELNVREQCANVCHTTIVQNAWKSGKPLWVHGWIYSLQDGILRDLGICIDGPGQIETIYRIAH